MSNTHVINFTMTANKLLFAKIRSQIEIIFIHLINLVSNVLGNDFLSCYLRWYLFKLSGMRLGVGTVIRGGGYFYGRGLVTGVKCQINRGCYFDFSEQITLGNNVVIGHGVTMITAHHELRDDPKCRAGIAVGKPIKIEDGVWIGANVTILPNITIGKGSVVGAGSLVTKDVTPNTLVVGNPAKIMKNLTS